MTDARLENIEKKIDAHGEALVDIRKALNCIAVQNEQITAIQDQLSTLWKKYDTFIDPNDGVITKITNFQASCPRSAIQTHIKWLWGTLIPFSATQIIIAIRLLVK